MFCWPLHPPPTSSLCEMSGSFTTNRTSSSHWTIVAKSDGSSTPLSLEPKQSRAFALTHGDLCAWCDVRGNQGRTNAKPTFAHCLWFWHQPRDPLFWRGAKDGGGDKERSAKLTGCSNRMRCSFTYVFNCLNLGYLDVRWHRQATQLPLVRKRTPKSCGVPTWYSTSAIFFLYEDKWLFFPPPVCGTRCPSRLSRCEPEDILLKKLRVQIQWSLVRSHGTLGQ